jgi:hypothetical protein
MIDPSQIDELNTLIGNLEVTTVPKLYDLLQAFLVKGFTRPEALSLIHQLLLWLTEAPADEDAPSAPSV